MNHIEARKWEDTLRHARESSSAAIDDLGYLDARAPERERSWRSLFAAWRARIRRRRELAGVSARDLRDAGLSIEAVEHELAQPFWRPLGRERK